MKILDLNVGDILATNTRPNCYIGLVTEIQEDGALVTWWNYGQRFSGTKVLDVQREYQSWGKFTFERIGHVSDEGLTDLPDLP